MAKEPFQLNDAQDHDDRLDTACQGAPPMITMRSIRPKAVAALGTLRRHRDRGRQRSFFMCAANPGLRVDVLVLPAAGPNVRTRSMPRWLPFVLVPTCGSTC